MKPLQISIVFSKQPDLAESNYRVSLSYAYNTDVKIKLGKAQLEDKNYQGAFKTFSELQRSRLKAEQKILVLEGLGDSNKGLENSSGAIQNYNSALSLSKRKNLDDKEISLNTKLADILQEQGNTSDAAGI